MSTIIIFLSSGLFLGWSLGANDAANVWGTAVGTRMVSFKKAALVASIFVILGAVISGSGASHTLGKLGAIDELAGAFTVALAAALSVFWMTKAALPVSTSQSIVGAVIGIGIAKGGKNLNLKVLGRISAGWIATPVIAAAVAFITLFIVQNVFSQVVY